MCSGKQVVSGCLSGPLGAVEGRGEEWRWWGDKMKASED